MRRYLLLVGVLGVALAFLGCETKSTKAPGGPSDATKAQPSAEPAATPAPATPAPKDAKSEPAADPFAPAPSSSPSLGIPELNPPEIAPPKLEKKTPPKPEAKH
jgi:hypothetical protein